MKLRKKLEDLKENIIGAAEEYSETKDMSAEEYAALFGESYTKLLKHVKTTLFYAAADQESDDFDVCIDINIMALANGNMLVNEDGFGKRETYNTAKVETMLKKCKYEVEFDTEDNLLIVHSKNKYIKYTEAVEEYVDKVKSVISEYTTAASETASEYSEEIKETFNTAKTAAKNTLKKTLKAASDWADKL